MSNAYRDRLARRPQPVGQVDDFQLLVPNSPGVRNYLAEKAAQQGVRLTVHREAPSARSERPGFVPGRFAMMPRDERQARYGKPLLYMDTGTLDEVPVVNVGWGTKSLEQLKDEVDELRHYGKDAVVDTEPPTDWNAVLGELKQMRKARRAGRKVFGPVIGRR